MNRIETKILNCSAVSEAEKTMVFAARLTQRGHLIHNMEDLIRLYTGKNGGAPSPREDRDAPASGSGQTTESKQSWQEHKEQQAAMRKRENQLNRLELEITDLEEQLRGIDAQLSDPDNGANVPLLMELSRSRQQLEDTLNKKMEEWESLA